MLLLSKIISSFILPPGVFITVFIIFFILTYKKNSRKLKIFLFLNILVLYILSIDFIGKNLILHLENKYPVLKNGKDVNADYIVILGGGIIASSPDENGKGSLSSSAIKRILYGAFLSKSMNLPIIVSGGRVLRGFDTESESEVAKRTLIRLGIDKDKILEENRSSNTWENAYFIKKKYGTKKIILITSAFHMHRSLHCFKSNNIDTIPAPTDYKVDRDNVSIFSFLPDIHSMNFIHIGLKEFFGYLYYVIRY